MSSITEKFNAHESNLVCCDCDEKEPSWASTNIGCFICTQCSGVHRSLGVHISAVRSIKIDEWTNALVNGMKDNATVNAEFEYHVPRDIFKPRSNSDRELRERYIQAKYVQRAFTQRHADQLRQPPLPDPALRLARQSTAGMVEFHGVLIVNVVGATNLLNSDIIGKSDPYVVLKTMGGSGPGQTVRTKTIDDNLNPIWNERLQLCIEDKATASLDIRVFDEDLKDDELIGKAVLPLSDVGDNEEQRHNILLAPQGTLRLTLLYTPIAH